MKRLIVYLCASFLLCGCNGMAYSGEGVVLELRASVGLDVEYTVDHGIEYLEISGHSLYSSRYGVQSVEESVRGNMLTVLVKLSTSGKSEKFSHRLRLSPEIDLVTFGTEKIVLWTRENGVDEALVERYKGSVI
jgi:hypothetical protein